MDWEFYRSSWRENTPDVVDVVICDPGYTEHVHQGHKVEAKPGAFAGGTGHRDPVSFDPADPHDFVPELLRVARRWVICFCAFEALGEYERAAGDAWVRSGVWLKPDACPQMSGDRPAVPGEAIAIMHRPGRKRWNGGGRKALWVNNRARGGERLHPTPKPVALMKALVRDFSESGELVWDPFAGCATTGVACLELGRRFIGHEIDPEHWGNGRERLASVPCSAEAWSGRPAQLLLIGKE